MCEALDKIEEIGVKKGILTGLQHLVMYKSPLKPCK